MDIDDINLKEDYGAAVNLLSVSVGIGETLNDS
jgi:hypothetical protein